MFLEEYDYSFFYKELKSNDSFHPFPQAKERKIWEKLLKSPNVTARYLHLKNEADATDISKWPQLTASLYMEFIRNGNRSNYEIPYFARRNMLGTLVLAEAFEHKGRYLDKITDALWMILEESSWCVPAHAFRMPGESLPRHDVHAVDLFAAETAMILAESYYILKDELEAHSQTLCAKLKNEIMERTIKPVMSYPDNFWWLCGNGNWSAWCASNLFSAAMYTVSDKTSLAAFAERMNMVMARYFDHCTKDGACDEGAMYWNVSAGAALVYLEAVYEAVSGKINLFNEDFIKRQAEFISNAYVGNAYFWGIADCRQKLRQRSGVPYRFGDRFNSEPLKNLALLARQDWNCENEIHNVFKSGTGALLTDALRDLFWIPSDAKAEKAKVPLSILYPSTEICMQRENADGSGLTFLIKGGHNGERHNHNDVGHFAIYADSRPLIADAGTMTYTRDTFSEKRYSLWCTRGSGHNAPIINGVEQEAGGSFKAVGFKLNKSNDNPSVSMNLEEAYHEKAGLKSLRREICLSRKSSEITLTDSFAMKNPVNQFRLNLLCPAKPLIKKNGLVQLSKNRVLKISGNLASAELNEIKLEDLIMTEIWGKSLFQLSLLFKTGKNACYSLTVFRTN